MAQVERARGVTKVEFYERFLGPRRPVILLDLTTDWAAPRKWTWDFFVANCGGSMLPLQRHAGLSRSYSYDDDDKLGVELRGYVKLLQAPGSYRGEGSVPYANGWQFDAEHPELLDDYHIPDLFEDWVAEQPRLVSPQYRWIYMGPPGSGTGLHIDNMGTHAWLTQIIGRKQWVLFAPDQLPLDYCDHADAFDPDLERFPAFRGLEPLEAILAPNETMFVPAGWRHQVRNLDATLALTENFANMSNFADHLNGIPPGHVFLRLATEVLARAKVEDFVERLATGHVDPRVAKHEVKWMNDVLATLGGAHQARVHAISALQAQLAAAAMSEP